MIFQNTNKGTTGSRYHYIGGIREEYFGCAVGRCICDLKDALEGESEKPLEGGASSDTQATARRPRC